MHRAHRNAGGAKRNKRTNIIEFKIFITHHTERLASTNVIWAVYGPARIYAKIKLFLIDQQKFSLHFVFDKIMA